MMSCPCQPYPLCVSIPHHPTVLARAGAMVSVTVPGKGCFDLSLLLGCSALWIYEVQQDTISAFWQEIF